MRGDETTTGSGARDALVTRLRTLEGELQRAQSELLAIGGAILPGLHLVVEAGGARGLLPTSRVSEVVRLVATAPLSVSCPVAAAPPHVGDFSQAPVDGAAAAGGEAHARHGHQRGGEEKGEQREQHCHGYTSILMTFWIQT